MGERRAHPYAVVTAPLRSRWQLASQSRDTPLRHVLGDEAAGVPDVVGQTGATRADHGRAMRHCQAGGAPGEAPRIGKHTEQRHKNILKT